jgi:thermolabile hemolysin
VEYLSQNLNATLSNFAYGGAVANVSDLANNPINVPQTRLPDIDRQLALFAARNLQLDQDKTLYTLFAGGNDMFQDLRTNEPLSGTAVANAIVNFISKLVALSNAKNVLVLNHGNYTYIPQIQNILTRTNNAQNQTRIKEIEDFPLVANEALKTGLEALQKQFPGLSIYQGNFNKLTNYLQTPEGQSEYNFTSTAAACLVETTQVSTDRTFRICENPEGSILWDDLHPTTKTHRVLADLMGPLVTEASLEYSYNGDGYKPSASGADGKNETKVGVVGQNAGVRTVAGGLYGSMMGIVGMVFGLMML